MKKIFVVLSLFLYSVPVCAKHLYSEKEYQTYWCNKEGGQTEYVLDDKARVDCLLHDYAVEFDFAPKWAECIGQALYYGKKTNRIPTCVLIMENDQNDLRYLNRLKYATQNQKFCIYTIQPDVFKK